MGDVLGELVGSKDTGDEEGELVCSELTGELLGESVGLVEPKLGHSSLLLVN